MVDFEKAYSDFIDRREYYEAQVDLFRIVRLTFKAGWEAAGGNPSPSQSVVQLFPQNPKK